MARQPAHFSRKFKTARVLDHDLAFPTENFRASELAEQCQAQGFHAEGGVVRRVDIHGVEATLPLFELGDEVLSLGVDQLHVVAGVPVGEQLFQTGVSSEIRLNGGDASAATVGLETDLPAAGTEVQESLTIEVASHGGKDRLLEPG